MHNACLGTSDDSPGLRAHWGTIWINLAKKVESTRVFTGKPVIFLQKPEETRVRPDRARRSHRHVYKRSRMKIAHSKRTYGVRRALLPALGACARRWKQGTLSVPSSPVDAKMKAPPMFCYKSCLCPGSKTSMLRCLLGAMRSQRPTDLDIDN